MHEPKFNQVAYFRKIGNLAINIRNTAGANRSADIDAMFGLVASGKLAAEMMPNDEKKAFLSKLQQISHVSSLTLGIHEAASATEAKHPNTKISGIATYSDGEIDSLAQQNYYDGIAKEKEKPKSGITDRRELEFNSAALTTVIISGVGKNSRRPTNIEFHGDSIKIFRDIGHAMSLTSEEIGGLLIQYCIKMKIPVPRNSSKSVRVTSKSVILIFTMELPEIPANGMAWPQAERFK